uniref:Uncharacterized protein n=1 Tax=Arundo donax TaxID=35708 RepID=A0A0A9HQC1_ARUDO
MSKMSRPKKRLRQVVRPRMLSFQLFRIRISTEG